VFWSRLLAQTYVALPGRVAGVHRSGGGQGVPADRQLAGLTRYESSALLEVLQPTIRISKKS